MKKTLFAELFESVQQMGEIVRGKRASKRTTVVYPNFKQIARRVIEKHKVALRKLAVLTVPCVAFLTGCNALHVIAKPQAADLHVDPMCYAPCTEEGTQITSDPDSAVIAAITEHSYRKACEVRRQACAQALKRGQDAGVIK